MAGYAGFSKSNNAVYAEDDGLMVASKLAAWCGRQWPRLRGLKAADIEAVMTPSEWHHTSKMFNEVSYYQPDEVTERGTRGKLYRLICVRRGARPIVTDGCSIKWLEWGGTRSHPKAAECTATGVSVTRTPGKAFLVLSGGTLRSPMRKLPTTRGLEIRDASGRLI